MIRARTGRLAAALIVAALVLSGCSAGNARTGGGHHSTITIAADAGLTSSNANAQSGDTLFNASVGAITNAWFNYYDSTPKLVENTRFGAVKLLKKTPETVLYTINPGVAWSDGTPVSGADLLLDWASTLDRNNNGASSALINGHRQFLNFRSAHSGSSLNDAGSATVSDDGRSMTLVYDNPNPDWRTALPADPIAAHAVYELAYPGTKPAAANAAVIDAIERRNIPAMIRIASVWRSAFTFTNTPSNKLLRLSDGAFTISSAVNGTSVVLSSNESYNWGPLPEISEVRFRVIADLLDQAKALRSGKVQLISGDGDDALATALKGLSGVTMAASGSGAWDHVDLTEDSGGPFDPASYGGDASKALLVRQAFVKALPREQMLDQLIKPSWPGARLDDSLTFLPGAAGYEASVAGNGSAAYATVDIPAARTDLKRAGVSRATVRVLYPRHNSRNAAEFALLRKSERKAGFTLVDDSSDHWSTILGDQSYDAALFAWQNTTLDEMASVSHLTIFSNDPSDFNGFRSRTIDLDVNRLVSELALPAQLKLVADIDKLGWADASSVPLFQTPTLTAWRSNVHGVTGSPLPPGIFWNLNEWTVGSPAR